MVQATGKTKQDGAAAPRSAEELTPCEEHRESLLADALDDSFPASDPPAITRPRPNNERCSRPDAEGDAPS